MSGTTPSRTWTAAGGHMPTGGIAGAHLQHMQKHMQRKHSQECCVQFGEVTGQPPRHLLHQLSATQLTVGVALSARALHPLAASVIHPLTSEA